MAKSSITSKLFLVLLLCAALDLVPAKALETNVSVDCVINVGIDLIKCAMTCSTSICFRTCATKMAPNVTACINIKPAPSPSPSPTPPPMRSIEAVAMISSSSDGDSVRGSLQFLQHGFHPPKTYIQGRFFGLFPGKWHGLHIHFNGSCGDHRSRKGASYLGLGNVVANADGVAEFYVAKSLTAQSVLGQAIVVHQLGNTEAIGMHCFRKSLACGIIRRGKA